MHRLSAIGISICAVLIGAIQMIMNPEGIGVAVSNSLGVSLLSAGGAIIAVGLVWMLSLGRETLT